MTCLTFQVWIGLGKHFSWQNVDSRRQNSNLLKVWEGPLTDLSAFPVEETEISVSTVLHCGFCAFHEKQLTQRGPGNGKLHRILYVFVLSVCSHLQETRNNPPNTWNNNPSSYYELTCRKCIIKKTDSWYLCTCLIRHFRNVHYYYYYYSGMAFQEWFHCKPWCKCVPGFT